MQNKEENLISINDIISRAKSRNVDFGKGDPRERLRYLTKIGLLPHAQRKSFTNGQPPNGAYPEYVIEILEEIDKKIKSGKSIQELKKEKEREGLIEAPYLMQSSFREEIEEVSTPIEEIQSPVDEVRSPDKKFKNLIFRTVPILKTGFLILLLGGMIIFFLGQTMKKDFYSYLFASFDLVQRFAQAPLAPEEQIPPAREIFLPAASEPYLTINAETDINAPLNVKEQITAPSFSLVEEGFRGGLVLSGLTADRTYTLPDLSGIVCLSTGNCVFETEEGKVFSPGGIPNRLAKFLSSDEIGISSIEDFYSGVALTIDSSGNIGIGTLTPSAKLEVGGNLVTTGRIGIGIDNPAHPLHVTGMIQATGDICTDLAGGRCLSTLPFGGGGGRAGIGGSGTAGYLPLWTAGTTLGDSLIYQTGGNLGIGTITPAQTLDVAGTIRMLGFQLPTGASDNYVLTSDADGIGTWRVLPPGVLPPGIGGQTLRYNGAGWIADSFLYNTGSAIGIGTTVPSATLTLTGNAVFATTTLPQFVLRHSGGNELSFAIDDEQSLIEASKRLVLNSLTGEIRLGGNVNISDNFNIFDAFGMEVRGATFISTTTDSTVRKSGELVFRASIPIFRYSVPSQTNSITETSVSRTFSMTDSLDLMTPEQLPGTNRIYAFLINFADNIATTSSSTWRVYRPIGDTEYSTFQFPGQGQTDLDIGNPHLTATTALPDNNWQLEVKVPLADRSIRIFNIFLLTFDQIN